LVKIFHFPDTSFLKTPWHPDYLDVVGASRIFDFSETSFLQTPWLFDDLAESTVFLEIIFDFPVDSLVI